MVEAQTYWRDGSDYLADAMATVIKAWDKNLGVARTATMFVYKLMKGVPVRNEQVFERFTKIVGSCFSRGDQRAFMLANLDLVHPTRPDTSRMVQLLRSDTPYVQARYHPQSYPAGLELLGSTCRLARKCMAEGKRSDAEWVLDHAYDRVPYLFSGGSGLRSFKAEMGDAVQTAYTMKPSRNESKSQRMILDKDGNVVSSPDQYIRWHG